MEVLVIDYGMGNLWSVINALRYLGVTPHLVNDPQQISEARTLILPGVGSFRKAMEALRARGMERAIHDAVRNRQAKMLGICLGMQLLGASSPEDGETPGLALVPNRVAKFDTAELGANKIPHIGFNQVRYPAGATFFAGLPAPADFYFVHSYRMLPEALTGELGVCSYGVEFLAAFRRGNIFGAQFHPEKSQTNGLILLKNFLAAPHDA